MPTPENLPATPSTPPPPPARPKRLDTIPHELRSGRRWVLWRYDERDGKPTKVPYQVNGRRAKADDPQTWATFGQVSMAMADQVGGSWGIGLQLAGGDVSGIDLDHCRDPHTGELESWAAEIVDELASYTEASPSGAGVHILVIGEPPPGRRRVGSFEMYGPADGRYLTVTGDHIATTPTRLATVDLTELHARYFPEPTTTERPAVATYGPPIMSDAEVLEHAYRAKNGGEIAALMGGGFGKYTGPSEAYAGLLHLLAFYTRDPAQLERLAAQSGIEPPEKRQSRRGQATWAQLEVAGALTRVTETWQAPADGPAETGSGNTPLTATEKAGPPLPPLPEFPFEILPTTLRDIVEAESERQRLPAGMIATAGLVVAAGAISAARAVQTDDRRHPASLWGVIVAGSGAGKSPALNVARKPFHEAALDRDDERRAAFIEVAKWQKLPKDEREQTPAPRVPPLISISDATTEALAEALSQAPRGLFMDIDELSTWANAMDAYRSGKATGGPDRGRYIQFWDGSRVCIIRKLQQPVVVSRPVVSLLGGMQPAVLGALNSVKDGLAQRFLFGYYAGEEAKVRSRAEPNRAALAAWGRTVRALLALTEGDPATTVLHMTEAAKELQHQGHARAVALQNTDPAGENTVYGKFEAHAARLALVLTMMDNPSTKMDEQAPTVDAYWTAVAWRLLFEFYAPHGTRALLGTKPMPTVPGYAWLAKRGTATAREMQRAGVAEQTTAAGVEALIDRLVTEAGCIKTVTRGRGGDTITVAVPTR